MGSSFLVRREDCPTNHTRIGRLRIRKVKGLVVDCDIFSDSRVNESHTGFTGIEDPRPARKDGVDIGLGEAVVTVLVAVLAISALAFIATTVTGVGHWRGKNEADEERRGDKSGLHGCCSLMVFSSNEDSVDGVRGSSGPEVTPLKSLWSLTWCPDPAPAWRPFSAEGDA